MLSDMNSKFELACSKLIPVFARNLPFFQKYIGSANNDHIIIIGIAMTSMIDPAILQTDANTNISLHLDFKESKDSFIFAYFFIISLSDNLFSSIYYSEFSISNFLIRLIDLRHHLLAFFHTISILSQIGMVLQRKIMVCTFDLFVGSILV